jgi:hypothetical protein
MSASEQERERERDGEKERANEKLPSINYDTFVK